MVTFPVQIEVLCSPGAKVQEAPGIDWLSPYRWVDEVPSNAAAHDHIVRTATAWLRASQFAWFEAVAAVYGILFFSDGREVTICVPGFGAPARITRITLGLITNIDAANTALEPGGTLQ